MTSFADLVVMSTMIVEKEKLARMMENVNVARDLSVLLKDVKISMNVKIKECVPKEWYVQTNLDHLIACVLLELMEMHKLGVHSPINASAMHFAPITWLVYWIL